MKQTKHEFNYRATIDSCCKDDGETNTGDIKMGPCSHRSNSEADTAGFSASAGADFIGELAKKKKERKNKILKQHSADF